MSEVADPAQPEAVPQMRDPPPSPGENEKVHFMEVTVQKAQNMDQDSSKEEILERSGSDPLPEASSSSPETSGNVVTPPELTSKAKVAHNFVPFNRGRVLSLDRGQQLMRVEIDESYHSSDTTTDNEEGDRHQRRKTNEGSVTAADSSPDDDDDLSSGSNTSDGESSYFAKHLPSPKSGRKFSLSSACSISSAPARAGYYPASNAHRESDASLSFSDDDDDWNDSDNVAPGSRRSPMLPPTSKEHQEAAEDNMQMYPQRITRMHSVSSLVSSSSEDGKHEQRQVDTTALSMSDESSAESVDTSTSDPSVRSELRDVASSKRRANRSRGSNRNSDVPSGRKSPVPPPDGELTIPSSDLIGRFFASPPRHPQPSPPTIFQGYAPANAHGIAHPQPQPLSSEQMAAWVAAGNSASHLMPPPMFYPPGRYGATMMAGPPHSGMYPPQHFPGDLGSMAPFRADISRSISDSNTTLPMVYSDDDDTDESAKFGHQMTGRTRQAARGNVFDRAARNEESLQERDGGDIRSAVDAASHQPRTRQRGSRNRSSKAPENEDDGEGSPKEHKGFEVYWRRWLMLMYMSVLNLLSDWTCYSVAPISILTSQAFGQINPELLVVVFLGANAVATACEPIILSRLGLRRTVVFGALLLMLGSIVKSGGLPPILQSQLVRGKDEWRIYMGFFLVGLSQPLYQCTPALLSASWFPERERTMATGVALNANQLGIGCAFIFGTLLVAKSDDIPKYFGLLSMISTITFAGCLIQFEDAPPTPPSETARIIRGTLELRFSSVRDMIWRSVRSMGDSSIARGSSRSEGGASSTAEQENPAAGDGTERGTTPGADASESGIATEQQTRAQPSKRRGGGASSRRRSSNDAVRSGSSGRRSGRTSSGRKSSGRSGPTSSSGHLHGARSSGTSGAGGASGGGSRRRSGASSRSQPASSDNGFRAGIPGMTVGPSPALLGGTEQVAREPSSFERESQVSAAHAPSPMMHGRVGPPQQTSADAHESGSPLYDNAYFPNEQENHAGDGSLPHGPYVANPYPSGPGVPMNPYWQYPYWDMYSQQQGQYFHPGDPYVYPQMYPHMYPYESPRSALMNTGTIDDGAEPVLTLTPHHLDINIRDDQVILSLRACFSRPGFIHALVAFTVSGIVINTLSTFMDYLVRLNGAGREYVGIVGGSFQFVIMISSLIVGKQTDKTRAYYSVIVGMLVLGAFGLAECGVSLDADRGGNLRWALVVVAALVGPLQPVSTELGVDVAYPLSENTVLVIQQLFSNLLSAIFIPFFKAVRDVGTETIDDANMSERPQYTFSFYLLIVLHAAATVFFATFNGRYLRFEHEQQKKALEEAKQMGGGTAFSPVQEGDFFSQEPYEEGDANAYGGERQALLHRVV